MRGATQLAMNQELENIFAQGRGGDENPGNGGGAIHVPIAGRGTSRPLTTIEAAKSQA